MASALLAATQPLPQEVPEPGKPGVRILAFLVPGRVETAHQIELIPSQPAPRPTEVLLGTLNDLGFRVLTAIPARLEIHDDSVVASWDEIDEFGTGASMSSACAELGHTLSELYRSLEADEENLGPDLQHVWSVLKEYLVRRR